MRSPILAALLYGTPAAVVSQTLWHGKRNGITELSQRAPPIFGWAVITFGHRPTSQLTLINMHMLRFVHLRLYFDCCKLPFVSTKCPTCISLHKAT